MDAFETYNTGNKYLSAGEFDAAIAAYTKVIAELPAFPLAYFNRAVAYSLAMKVADERRVDKARTDWRDQVLVDLWTASALGFDERLSNALDEDSFFQGISAYVIEAGGYTTLFEWCEDEKISQPVRMRLLEELMVALDAESYLLTQAHAAQILFNTDRLPARLVVGDILHERRVAHRILSKALIAFEARHELEDDDPELAWRVTFLLGWILYCAYQTTEFGRSGMVHDTSFIDNMFFIDEADIEHLEDYIVGEAPQYRSCTRLEILARFSLDTLFEAANQLCELRLARIPPAGTADIHWLLAGDLFKSLIATTVFLDDAEACHQAICVMKKFGAIVGVRGWMNSVARKRLSARENRALEAFEPISAADLRDILGDRGLAVQYVLYEAGTDHLVRLGYAASGLVISECSIDSNHVVLLMLMSRQWEIPPSLREEATDAKTDEILDVVAKRRDPKILTEDGLRVIELNQAIKDPWLLAHDQNLSDEAALRRRVIASFAASSTVPLHGYPSAADGVVIGESLRKQVAGARRLVIVPFNYLNNLPWHLLSSVREAIDSGQLEEIIVAPTAKLLWNSHRRNLIHRDRARVLFVGLDVAGSINANEELRRIRGVYPQAEKLVGKQATRERIVKSLKRFDVVHIACHGGFDWERNSPFLQLADGRLYPEDCLAEDLKNDLIVLNACVSGVVSRESREGDQTLSLPTAFLAAGVRQVVGALWEVEETSALEFAGRFFSEWAASGEKTTARIVLEIQKYLRSLPGKSDPYYWAPHVVFGDWR